MCGTTKSRETAETRAKKCKLSTDEERKPAAGEGWRGSGSGSGKGKELVAADAEPPKDYIHVRARRGQATDSHSLAERVRRRRTPTFACIIPSKKKTLAVDGCHH
jgi:hypothetical protein